MSGFRNRKIYVQRKTEERLAIAMDLYEKRTGASTVDEFADRKLNEIISKEYPLVLEVERKRDEALSEVRKQTASEEDEELPF